MLGVEDRRLVQRHPPPPQRPGPGNYDWNLGGDETSQTRWTGTRIAWVSTGGLSILEGRCWARLASFFLS